MAIEPRSSHVRTVRVFSPTGAQPAHRPGDYLKASLVASQQKEEAERKLQEMQRKANQKVHGVRRARPRMACVNVEVVTELVELWIVRSIRFMNVSRRTVMIRNWYPFPCL